MFEISLPDLLFLINVPLQSRSISSLFHILMPKNPKQTLFYIEGKNNTNHSVHIKKNHGAQAVNGHRTVKRMSAANPPKIRI